MIWFSHILIRHKRSDQNVTFSVGFWTYPETPPRTREDALELALAVAARAMDGRDTFETLARAYSDDISTTEAGGAIGGIDAARLDADAPQVLDALAALEEGQVSRVVESKYGFHILRRETPPTEEKLSAERIVIAYDNASWLHRFLARGRPPSRSRLEAIRLASELSDLASSSPARFTEFVARYTEHRDARSGGDLGSWSTRESTAFYRELDVLRRLKIGEVSAPVDSFIGMQVLKRTAPRPRKMYALSAIRLAFDPALQSGDLSKTGTFSRISRLAKTVRRHPERFLDLQREFCCEGIEQWQEGRGSIALSGALDGLRVGQIGRAVVQSDSEYFIVRRVEPSAERQVIAEPEFPAPRAPDVEYFVRLRDRDVVLSELASALASERAQSGAAVGPDAFAPMRGLPTDLIELNADLRRKKIKASYQQIRTLLGPDRYGAFTFAVNKYVERRVGEALDQSSTATMR